MTTRKPPGPDPSASEPSIAEPQAPATEPAAGPENVLDFLAAQERRSKRKRNRLYRLVWTLLTLLLAMAVGYLIGAGMETLGRELFPVSI